MSVDRPRGISWSAEDVFAIPASIRAEADAEYAKVVDQMDAELGKCNIVTCPDHADHIAWAIRKEDQAQKMIWGWAWSRTLADAKDSP